MDTRRILRSPDVTQGVVTLSSALGASSGVGENVEQQPVLEGADAEIHEAQAASSPDPEVIESELEQRLKQMIEAERAIEQREAELSAREKTLEEQAQKLKLDAESYRDEIFAEISQKEKQQAEDKVRETLEQFNQLLDSMSERMQSEIEEVGDELVAIVFESVCKIIGEAFKDESVAVSSVKEVMKSSQDRMEMSLRVSEKDYQAITDASAELSYGLSNRINIMADDHVRYGGCILETTAGRIDGRLEQQMSRLMQVLLNSRS